MNLAHKIATHVTISRTTLPRDTLPRDAALDAYTYEDLAFDAVLEELVPVADPSVSPLFQLIFIWQNAPKINFSRRDNHRHDVLAATVMHPERRVSSAI
jgi:hypothetical protein